MPINHDDTQEVPAVQESSDSPELAFLNMDVPSPDVVIDSVDLASKSVQVTFPKSDAPIVEPTSSADSAESVDSDSSSTLSDTDSYRQEPFIEPVGVPVQFVHELGAEKVVNAAILVKVGADKVANLTCFNDNGTQFAELDVPFESTDSHKYWRHLNSRI